MDIEVLLLSDLHLGDPDCNWKGIRDVLKKEGRQAKQIIIVGDLFDSRSHLPRKHRFIVRLLRCFRKKLVILDGNHDPVEDGRVQAMFGITSKKQYAWELAGKKFLALHGNGFDEWCILFCHWTVDWLFLCAIWLLVNLGESLFGASEWLADRHRRFSQRIKDRILRHAKEENVQEVISGHVHIAEQTVCKKTSIGYTNCGHWTKGRASYVTIDNQGTVQLHVIC